MLISNIYISYCKLITDFGLSYLCDSDLRINSINLSGCDITYMGLYCLSISNLPVNCLDISHCKHVSNKGLICILDSNLPITEIDIEGCCSIIDRNNLPESALRLIINHQW